MNFETVFNDAKMRGNHKFVRDQIDLWLRTENMPKSEVGRCVIFTFESEFFVVNRHTFFYMSFDNEEKAFDYCLDNLNGTGKQTRLL